MALYTLIVDYDGGTYVMQAHADSNKTAPSACINQWDISDIKDVITESDKITLLEQLAIEKPTALQSIINVWYGNVELHEKCLSFNLILTKNAS